MAFPHIKFGKCERCGGGGTSSSGTVQETGYELKEYFGDWLCQICINILKDERRDEVAREKDKDGKKFRESIGFTGT